MVTPQALLCKLSWFNTKLMKYQLNCWVIDFSIKRIAKEMLLSPFSPTTSLLPQPPLPSGCVCTHTHTQNRCWNIFLLSLSTVLLLTTSATSLFFLYRGLLLIFCSSSTNILPNLIWKDNFIYPLCVDYPWIYICKPFPLPFKQIKILASLSDVSLWIYHQQTKLDMAQGQFLISHPNPLLFTLFLSYCRSIEPPCILSSKSLFRYDFTSRLSCRFFWVAAVKYCAFCWLDLFLYVTLNSLRKIKSKPF